MLPLATILEIRRMLAEGTHSRRTIAARTGVARDTVRAVASGQRRIEPHTAERDRAPRRYFVKPITMPERCPGCGGLVHMPCRLCQVREFQRRNELIRRLRHASINPRSAA